MVIEEAHKDAISVQSPIMSEPTTHRAGSLISSIRRPSVDILPSSIGSSLPPLSRQSMDNSPTSTLDRIAKHSFPFLSGQVIGASGCLSDLSRIRHACRYDCYCMCHAHDTTRSDRLSSKLAASKLRCTEPQCQATSLEGKTETASSFFRKFMSQVMSSKCIKVRYDLNTYRMVAEGSDAMRYVKHGNLEKLKTCIRSGEATLWDTAPDGWSLLHVSRRSSWYHGTY